ncbi:hypothetical protein MC885_006630, partial [Smutsia gigantea]
AKAANVTAQPRPPRRRSSVPALCYAWLARLGAGWGQRRRGGLAVERGEPLSPRTGKSGRGARRAGKARQCHAAFVQSWAAGGTLRAGAPHTRDRAQSWPLLSGGGPPAPQPLKAERARVSLGFRVSPAVSRVFCSSLPASQV